LNNTRPGAEAVVYFGRPTIPIVSIDRPTVEEWCQFTIVYSDG